ncbi:carboxylate-amine ligase [bacterium]|nr:carboxylate-amine ligase [bacterium]
MAYYKQPSFNIGIEEEYQLIDPESRELLGFLSQSMSREQMLVRERRPDLDFAQRIGTDSIEVGTPVCEDVKSARAELVRIRSTLMELGQSSGFKVAAAGTHPFSHWASSSRDASPTRYRALLEDAQIISRRLLAFGMDIHIGVEDRDLAIDVMTGMRYLLPHILCLASSSPFWLGHNTGLKSYRAVLLDALPRTGIPGEFRSYHAYEEYVETLIRTNSIPGPGHIWWDIRPHHRFPTLEIRICDMMPNIEDVLAMTALVQAIVAWMVDLRQRNMTFRLYERILIAENKWRALRYGLAGKLIDFGIAQEVDVRDLIRELLERIEPIADRLGSRAEIEHIHTMLARGSSSDLQVKYWQEHGQDGKALVDYLIAETEKLA